MTATHIFDVKLDLLSRIIFWEKSSSDNETSSQIHERIYPNFRIKSNLKTVNELIPTSIRVSWYTVFQHCIEIMCCKNYIVLVYLSTCSIHKISIEFNLAVMHFWKLYTFEICTVLLYMYSTLSCTQFSIPVSTNRGPYLLLSGGFEWSATRYRSRPSPVLCK